MKNRFLVLLLLLVSACGMKIPTDGAGSVGALTSGVSDESALTDGGSAGVDGFGEAIGDTASGATSAGATQGATTKGATGVAAEAAASGKSIFSSETEGITDKQITICSHIPMTGAAPIPRHPDRFGKFYFDYVNAEKGGIHGRKVRFITKDDQYYPAGALTAVEQCKKEGTFLYTGAAGTDQIVAVAKSFAAVNKVPYLAGPASSRDLEKIPQVKMIGPDYESQHVLLADYLVKNAKALTGKDKPVFGMLRVNSPFFKNGHDVFVEELAKRGFTLAVDKVVQKDENQFTDVMLEMQREGVDIINNFTTPNIWIKLLKQNNNPNYQPLFTAVSPAAGYNIIATALADARAKAVLFHHLNPPYDKNDTSVAWQADKAKFLEIFRKYSPEQCANNDPLCPDDFDYSSYLAARGLEQLLLKAGRDITRTSFWNMLSTHRDDPASVYPQCPLDFSKDGFRGANAVNVFRLDGSRWTSVQLCLKP